MKLAGYVARTEEINGYISVWKPEGRRPLGKPRHTWDNIQMDTKEIGRVWIGFIWLRIAIGGGLLWAPGTLHMLIYSPQWTISNRIIHCHEPFRKLLYQLLRQCNVTWDMVGWFWMMNLDNGEGIMTLSQYFPGREPRKLTVNVVPLVYNEVKVLEILLSILFNHFSLQRTIHLYTEHISSSKHSSLGALQKCL
jgi:hypothetical protein